jgi:hypothetical protein
MWMCRIDVGLALELVQYPVAPASFMIGVWPSLRLLLHFGHVCCFKNPTIIINITQYLSNHITSL